eukprot:6117687-Prymnesium_polylepis.1
MRAAAGAVAAGWPRHSPRTRRRNRRRGGRSHRCAAAALALARRTFSSPGARALPVLGARATNRAALPSSFPPPPQ